ncbi:MAG: Ditrans,polycis-undecaprenyl-diphosphate synthase ((2E,6E)-farnesyl-diphosphate specific) [Chlamydiia bacterium]|nr:Ditrans,polycis-undecaprenyl-diphosphate synthase ((2E,6E)-farnesyl-diphosphate specific) [Chlamydiia bacterium]
MDFVVCKDTPEAAKALRLKKVPKHVAIIMDGNRRWARCRNKPVDMGHWYGAERVRDIVNTAALCGVENLTLYTFSTENWARPRAEVQALIQLFDVQLRKMRSEMLENGVRLQTIGNISHFPAHIQNLINETKAATAHCNRIQLILALNYGGRDDLRRAALRAFEDMEEGKLRKSDFTEEVFGSYLDTHGFPDPELLIRTSGESRISNFLLWQLSYAEIYVTDVLWPDFEEEDFYKALEEYGNRQRRNGE